MILTEEQKARFQALHAARDLPFSDMVRAAGLDKRFAFIRANLRGVDFKTSDLSGFNFAEADLTGADLTQARGTDTLVLVNATLDNVRGRPRSRELREPPGPEMVEIPAGSFDMGIPTAESKREQSGDIDEEARPVHRVTIPRPFWIGKYPVTRSEFAAFVADTGRVMPTFQVDELDPIARIWNAVELGDHSWLDRDFAQTDRDPVVRVTHEDAVAYAAWLGNSYRLPSEAEWEYAARGGTQSARFWGDDRDQACRYANVADRSLMTALGASFDAGQYFPGDDGFAFTSPVGSFLPNPFGLYDMLGNVWEWCADPRHNNYRGAPTDGSVWTAGPGTALRVARGGSWSVIPRITRAGYRFGSDISDRSRLRAAIGFRVVRT